MLAAVTTLLLSGSLCALTCGPAWSAEPKRQSPWQGTGLELGFIADELDTRRCYQSDLAFLSCLGAIQGILDLHGHDLHLLPLAGQTPPGGQARVVKRFGEAAIVEDKRLRIGADGNALEIIRARRQRILHWQGRRKADGPRGIDFTALRAWLLAEIIGTDRPEAFAAAAVNGYLSVGDSHARIVPALSLQDAPAEGRGPDRTPPPSALVYTGIGAVVHSSVDAAIVNAVIRQGPAARAGLRAQDFILEVDGESIAGLASEQVVARLRGRSGSSLVLTVKRQDQMLQIPVVRDAVTAKNVVAYEIVDRGWQFAYLRIDSFLSPNTCREVRSALGKRLTPTLNGIILDLRGNAGGLVNEAVCVADLFLAPDQVVLEIRNVEDPDAQRRIRTRRPAASQAPLVTLVNVSTGSASEVLAGALQDHARTFVVGERTFGKGTVQSTRPWQGMPSVIEYFTAARYYRPSGAGVQRVGIEPDRQVHDHPGSVAPDRILLREADLFPTALPREPQRWHAPDPERSAQLEACSRQEGLAQYRWHRQRQSGGASDYPLSVAQDVLVCILTRR